MNGGVRGFHTSAFTVAELGEMLRTIEKLGFHSGKTSISSDHIFCVADMVTGSGEFDYFIHSTVADNEANARAKMLVYLLENKPTKL